MRKGGYFSNHSMYDYIRLELPGYVPPAPASVAAYAGNNCNLICWPVTPGATGYNILRSTTSGSGYVSITNGVIGPVCGSGLNNGVYLDTTAGNGTTYYYVVQSANTGGASANSPESTGATPSGSLSTSAPAAPTGLAISSVGHQSVAMNWSASPGANFYTVYRSTLFDNGGGASNVLGTIVLANNVTAPTYTDTSPTDGSIYSYSVSAASAGGISSGSTPAVAVPLPAPPASAPGSLTGVFVSANIVLQWSPVSEAVGYIIRRATSPSGPFTLVMSVTETRYTDAGLTPGTTYYYQVAAVNAAGVSANATVTVVPAPVAPASLSAIPGNAQVTLSWTAVPGAAGYYLFSGMNSGGETTLVAGNYSGTSYTNTGLINGTTYYYVVASTNANGLSPNSPEASATPNVNIVNTPRNLTWRGDGAANIWDVDGADNWVTNNVATIFNNGDTVSFDNTGSNNVPVALAGAPQPALVVFNSSRNYTLGGVGSISGTNQLIKMGSGTLTIDNTNLYSGGTIISNSTVFCGTTNANNTGWGMGPIILMGGTVQFDGYGGANGVPGWAGCTNTINVPSGKTGTLLLPPRFGYSSPFSSALTGGGTLNVTIDYVRDYFTGDWSAFTGRINVTPRSGPADFRINNSAGYANAAIFLNNGVNLYNVNANNQTTDIGELGGSGTAFIGAGSLSSSNPTWRIGAKNTTNTYAGTIADAGVTSLIKTGTGMFVLSGTNNTYSGGTTVNGGILMVSNTAGTATGVGPVTVTNGGTLAGSGIIGGAVTINSGGALAPGNPLGNLTLSNSLTLAAGSTTFAQLEHSPLTNDVVNVMGAVTEGGTLNVTNIGVAALANGDSFKLFNAAGYSGSFAGYVLPPLTGSLRWNTGALNSSGVLSVIALTSPTITGLQMVNGSLVMSGSGGVSNWPYYVLASTNLTLPAAQWTPISTNQFDTGGNFVVTNAISAGSPQMFYRVQLQ
jgi:autotransporter-associated beta strand protein